MSRAREFRFFRRLSLIFFFDSRLPKHNKLSKLSQLYCFLRPTEIRNLCVLHQNRQVSGDTLKKKKILVYPWKYSCRAKCEHHKLHEICKHREIIKSLLETTCKVETNIIKHIFCVLVTRVILISYLEKMSSMEMV